MQARTKLCNHVGCSNRPTHNFPSQMPIVCEHHASAGMSDVQKRLCIHIGASHPHELREGCCREQPAPSRQDGRAGMHAG